MFEDFLALLFPENCASCNSGLVKNEHFICIQCRMGLPKTNFHLYAENPLSLRLWGRIPLSHALAYLYYQKGGSVQKMLYRIKYKGFGDGSKILGSWYGAELMQTSWMQEYDFIVPVPLHKKKQKKRGFNQSALFAEGLSGSMGILLRDDLLERTEDRMSQTGKGRFERWLNVKDIYRTSCSSEIKGKSILIADDVVTTGATIEACGQALLDAGAVRVGLIALACAL